MRPEFGTKKYYIHLILWSIGAGIGLTIASPFLLIYFIYDILTSKNEDAKEKNEEKKKYKIYDIIKGKYVSVNKAEYEQWSDKVYKREIDLTNIPHVTPTPLTNFLCHGERRYYYFPYSLLAYVDSMPDTRLNDFFKRNSDWIDMIGSKYGIYIVHLKDREIRVDMFYPQDFNAMHHGLVYKSGDLDRDPESGIAGDVFNYVELDPDDDDVIKGKIMEIIKSIYKRQLLL